MNIRSYDPVRDHDFLRGCVVELQETERAFDPRRPEGEAMADAYLEQLMGRVRDWAGAIFVAEDEGVRVGLCTLFTRVPEEDPDEPTGWFALVSDLVVPAPHREKGVGAALLAHAEAFARKAGAPVLRIESVAGNEGAVRLYRRAGFEPRVVNLEKTLIATDGHDEPVLGDGAKARAET